MHVHVLVTQRAGMDLVCASTCSENLKVLIKFATLAVQINLLRVCANRLLCLLSHSDLFISLFIYLFAQFCACMIEAQCCNTPH